MKKAAYQLLESTVGQAANGVLGKQVWLRSHIRRILLKQQFTLDKDRLDRWYRLPVEERNQQNNALIDERLLPWRVMVRRSQKKPLPGLAGFHVIFFHIPKTGGTTLDYLTAKNYRIDFVQQVNAPALDEHVAGAFKNKRAYRAYLGHYELNDVVYQLLDRPKLVQFTMLREPVSRVVSYYDYLRSSPNHPKYPIAKDLTLAEFVQHPEIDEVENGQSYRILGLLKHGLHHRCQQSEKALIDAVTHQLEHRFSLFGLTERFDDFLIMAQRTLGWPDIFYKRLNESRVKTDKRTIPAETLEIIRQRNRIDSALYEFATRLFDQRFKRLGLDSEDTQRFQAANQSFVDLLQWHQWRDTDNCDSRQDTRYSA